MVHCRSATASNNNGYLLQTKPMTSKHWEQEWRPESSWATNTDRLSDVQDVKQYTQCKHNHRMLLYQRHVWMNVWNSSMFGPQTSEWTTHCRSSSISSQNQWSKYGRVHHSAAPPLLIFPERHSAVCIFPEVSSGSKNEDIQSSVWEGERSKGVIM